MRVNSYKNCLQSYGSGWEPSDDEERAIKLKTFPHSVIVEGAYGEDEMAKEWCQKNISSEKDRWVYIWYGKIDYDYGFWEFFFKEQKDATAFKDAVPTFYAETAVGRWRSDGPGNPIKI